MLRVWKVKFLNFNILIAKKLKPVKTRIILFISFQFHAMDTLHKHSYSIEAAMCSLVPSSGPVLCRDEMEEWSASEANLFEDALEKYGKDFNDIRNDFVSSTYRKVFLFFRYCDERWTPLEKLISLILHFSCRGKP